MKINMGGSRIDQLRENLDNFEKVVGVVGGGRGWCVCKAGLPELLAIEVEVYEQVLKMWPLFSKAHKA